MNICKIVILSLLLSLGACASNPMQSLEEDFAWVKSPSIEIPIEWNKRSGAGVSFYFKGRCLLNYRNLRDYEEKNLEQAWPQLQNCLKERREQYQEKCLKEKEASATKEADCAALTKQNGDKQFIQLAETDRVKHLRLYIVDSFDEVKKRYIEVYGIRAYENEGHIKTLCKPGDSVVDGKCHVLMGFWLLNTGGIVISKWTMHKLGHEIKHIYDCKFHDAEGTWRDERYRWCFMVNT
jgi:hypothetical protein